MNLFDTADIYLNRIVGAKKQQVSTVLPGSRIKVLLLDKVTIPILSMVSTQSELLANDIYLINRIENTQRDKMRHLSCVVYANPNDETINYLLDELRNPKYSKYELYFNNTITKTQLERLAESDDLEVVVKVEELFHDYFTINSDLFSLNSHYNLYGDVIDTWNPTIFKDTVNCLSSLLLSLKLKPIIRYEANSKMAAKLSKELVYNMEKENCQLFDFKLKDTPPQLLILDRKNDPITPLLIPWTFQSMVHELIGIDNNTADLSDVASVSEDLQKIVLSSKRDAFYNQAMYLNFGDLSDKIKDYVFHYKSRTNSSKKIDSIEDMKKFIEEFPEFKKLSGNVSKHMTLASELDRRINKERLWEVSELEQNLSCHDQHNSDLRELEKLLLNTTEQGRPPRPPISEDSKIVLVALYALRYETNHNNQTNKLKQILKDQGVALHKIDVIDYLLMLSGHSQRLDEEQSIFNKAASSLISGFKTNHKTDNIYMQHVPRLEQILSKAVRGKLSEKNYPIVSPYSNGEYSGDLALEKALDIVIFIVGGVTYEEARIVNNLNRINKNVRIVLGGTSVHNTKSFLKEIEDAGARWPKTTASGRLYSRVN